MPNNPAADETGRDARPRESAARYARTVRASRRILFLSVYASGFAVTAIEISLARLLAPYFGASLTVWAAIIATLISALSVGYPLGGWVADRRPEVTFPLAALLAGGILGAGLGLGVPHWLQSVLAGSGFAGWEFWQPLACTLLVLSLPCVLLAMVAPAALRVTLRDHSTVGRDAGILYALGSIGSVLGVLLPALWWIPVLGLRATFLIIGVIAVAPAIVGLLVQHRRSPRVAALAAVLLLVALSGVPEASRYPDNPAETVLYDRDSGLQRIRVSAADVDGNRVRRLQLNEGWSVHSWLREPDFATGDVWDWMALSALIPKPVDGSTDVLIVGLAGGTVSNLITRLLLPQLGDVAITGIELDPEVIAVADRYFDLDRRYLKTVAADGRIWLRGTSEKFDLIILDAYHQPSIPAHLATLEFFEDVRAHLTSEGIAVLNVFAPAGESRILSGIGATWGAVFARAQLLRGPESNGLASHLLLGGPAVPIDIAHIEVDRISEALRPGWELFERIEEFRVDLDVQPWTDDRAPIELLTDRAYRKLRPPNPIWPSSG